MASSGLRQDTGCSGLVHWDDPEGWYGEGEIRSLVLTDTLYKTYKQQDLLYSTEENIQYFVINYHGNNLIYIYIHLEKAMATHSSTLAWKILWMEEPGRL